MHKAEYTDRIEIVEGKVARVTRADFKKYSEDVYLETENKGECYCRYVGFSCYCGYGVYFPGERLGYYYGNQVAEEEDFAECEELPLHAENLTTEEDKKVVTDKYPEFKYVLKKWDPRTNYNLMRALKVWKEHKEVELLLACKLEQLAFSKAFYRLTDKKKKQIINYVKDKYEDLSYQFLNYKTLLHIANKNIPSEYVRSYVCILNNFKEIDKETIKYLLKKHNKPSEIILYHDYLNMLKGSIHNAEDEYWKFPKDLRASHNRLIEEISKAEKLKNLETDKAYKKVVKKFLKFNSENYKGYSIYIPKDIEDISFQATALNQCLITCNYPKRVIDKKCCLVFIRQNDVPIATAEITPEREIKQFYANEKDRYNCKPSDEVRAVFMDWFNKSAIYKTKKKTA